MTWLLGAGYGPEEESCVYELTYNYGQDKYDNFKGEGYAQVAMSTEVRIPPLSITGQLKQGFQLCLAEVASNLNTHDKALLATSQHTVCFHDSPSRDLIHATTCSSQAYPLSSTLMTPFLSK